MQPNEENQELLVEPNFACLCFFRECVCVCEFILILSLILFSWNGLTRRVHTDTNKHTPHTTQTITSNLSGLCVDNHYQHLPTTTFEYIISLHLAFRVHFNLISEDIWFSIIIAMMQAYFLYKPMPGLMRSDSVFGSSHKSMPSLFKTLMTLCSLW